MVLEVLMQLALQEEEKKGFCWFFYFLLLFKVKIIEISREDVNLFISLFSSSLQCLF